MNTSPSPPDPTAHAIHHTPPGTVWDGGGQMGELMRAYDWDQHPLGPPRQWPESLRTGVRMMLHSGYPMFIWWSADLYMFHNDAYAPTLVGRHGEALGAQARHVWADVWGQLGGVVEDVLAKGTTFYAEDMLVIPERKGFKEETYWTFSYSPMPDDAGRVNGIFCACSDVTAKVLSQRRLSALHQLSEGSHSWHTVAQLCAHTFQVLEKQPSDLPFAALYLVDPSAQIATLKGQTGRGQRLPPHVSLPAESDGSLPFGQSLRARERVLPDHILAQLELEATGDSAHPKAVVLPLLGAADQPQLLGFLVAGVSPMLEYNQAYRDFHQLLSRHLGTALQGVASREQQRRQADLLGAILDGASSSIASFTPLRDATGQIVDMVYQTANRMTGVIAGMPPQKLIGQRFLSLYPGAARDGVFARFLDVMESGEPFWEEVSYLHPEEGVDGYFLISLVRQGEAIVQTVLDISTQKRAQVLLQQHSQELAVTNEELRTTNEELAAANEELARAKAALERLNGQLEERVVARTRELQRAHQEAQRQRQVLDTLFMKAPAPIVILEGAQLVYRLVNPAYQQIFPGRVLLHKPLLEALPEVAGTAIYATLSKVYQTGETYVAQEMPLMLARHQEGPLEEIYLTFTYQARRDDQGVIDGVLVFAYEVTDQVLARRRIEESARQVAASYQQLESVNQQLQKINADLDTFVYTASHDLKAPLVNIEGLLKVLQKQIGPVIGQNKAVEELLALLDSQVKRFKTTIGDLTDVARVGKESPADVAGIELAPILEEVLQDLQQAKREASARIEIELNCPTVHFSRKNLKSVLYNLLSNAIKYRSPERQLRIGVSCQTQGDYHVLTVADNGLGVNPGQVEKMFTLFKRFHTHVPGTGMGLHIVKKMLENAEGRIEVESQVDVGSIFRIYFKK